MRLGIMRSPTISSLVNGTKKSQMFPTELETLRILWWVIFLCLIFGLLLLASYGAPQRQCLSIWSNATNLSIPANTWTDVIFTNNGSPLLTPNYGCGPGQPLTAPRSQWQLLSDLIRLQTPPGNLGLYVLSYHVEVNFYASGGTNPLCESKLVLDETDTSGTGNGQELLGSSAIIQAPENASHIYSLDRNVMFQLPNDGQTHTIKLKVWSDNPFAIGTSNVTQINQTVASINVYRNF
jgi:hypothetical protein